jgi:hypothetical protein
VKQYSYQAYADDKNSQKYSDDADGWAVQAGRIDTFDAIPCHIVDVKVKDSPFEKGDGGRIVFHDREFPIQDS